MKKIILALCWVAGWIHVFFFSPEGGQSTADFIVDVMQPGGGQVDPLVFTVFNLLGIWPLIMVVKPYSWLYALVPVLGATVYLVLRPRLPEMHR
jgi:hypothetical protein